LREDAIGEGTPLGGNHTAGGGFLYTRPLGSSVRRSAKPERAPRWRGYPAERAPMERGKKLREGISRGEFGGHHLWGGPLEKNRCRERENLARGGENPVAARKNLWRGPPGVNSRGSRTPQPGLPGAPKTGEYAKEFTLGPIRWCPRESKW